MARARYKSISSHIKLNKKTSQTSRKGRVKMASMNKNKKRDFKPYNRQEKKKKKGLIIFTTINP